MAAATQADRRHRRAAVAGGVLAGAVARSERSHAHRIGQASLATLAARAFAEAWRRLFDPHDLRGSSQRLAAAVEAIAKHYGRASSSAALTHYRNERRAQEAPGLTPRLSMPSPPTADEIQATVDKVLSPLYGPSTPEAEQRAEDALSSEVEQMVLEQGRQAVIGAVQSDRAARAWARVTEPGACSFCRLLATRGAVYKSEATANFRAHVKKPDGSGGTCRCGVEPAFGQYEMTAEARQDLADYQRLADEYGHSGRAIEIAWRQHVEGREVTGPKTKPYTRRST